MSKRFQTNSRLKLGKSASGKFTKDNFYPALATSGKLPTNEQFDKVLKGMSEEMTLANMLNQTENFYTLAAYSSVYTKVSHRLVDIIKSVDSIRYFYLVDTILNQIAEDALSPRMGDDNIVNFSCDDEDIQKELDELQKRIGLDQLIENITPDLLAYGEYTLKTEIGKEAEPADDELNGKKRRFKSKRSGKGLVDVKDIIEQGKVVSLTQDGRTEGYIVYDEVKGKIEVKEVADYIKFTLGGQRVKIDFKDIIPVSHIKNPAIQEVIEKIPRFIRIGKSMLYNVIPKIKELEILEKLIPATKINKLSQGNLIGMNLPENYELEEALKAVKRIESMVNKKVSVDPQTNEITVEAILSTAGKTKVIPLFGDKGRLEQMDFRDPEPDDLLGSVRDIREIILDSIGVPSELVFKSESDNRSEVIKRYAKYLRKLKRVQKCITNGCKQMAFIHLSNRGIPFKEEQIDVVFNNTLVEIDNLDKLEHADVTLSLLGNVRDFFNDMVEEDSPYRENTNLNKVVDYLEDNLRTIGLSDAIKTKEEGGGDADAEAVDVDGIDSEGNPTRAEEEPAEDDSQEFEKTEGE